MTHVTPLSAVEAAPTTITASLSAHVHPHRAYECIFGPARVAAARLNASALSCPVPALRAGNYSLRVACDGADLCSRAEVSQLGNSTVPAGAGHAACLGASFQLHPQPDVFSWAPKRPAAPGVTDAQRGGAVVGRGAAREIVVSGRGFLEELGLACSFGGVRSDAAWYVPYHRRPSDTLRWSSPPSPHGWIPMRSDPNSMGR